MAKLPPEGRPHPEAVREALEARRSRVYLTDGAGRRVGYCDPDADLRTLAASGAVSTPDGTPIGTITGITLEPRHPAAPGGHDQRKPMSNNDESGRPLAHDEPDSDLPPSLAGVTHPADRAFEREVYRKVFAPRTDAEKAQFLAALRGHDKATSRLEPTREPRGKPIRIYADLPDGERRLVGVTRAAADPAFDCMVIDLDPDIADALAFGRPAIGETRIVSATYLRQLCGEVRRMRDARDEWEPGMGGPAAAGVVGALRADNAALVAERDALRERLGEMGCELDKIADSRNRNKTKGKAAAKRAKFLREALDGWVSAFNRLCEAVGLDGELTTIEAGFARVEGMLRESAGVTPDVLADWAARVMGAAKVAGGGEGDRVVLFAHAPGRSETPELIRRMMGQIVDLSGGAITPVICPPGDYVWIEDVEPLKTLRGALDAAIAYMEEPTAPGELRRGVKLGNPAVRVARDKGARQRARGRAVGRLDGIVQTAAAVAGQASSARGIGDGLPLPTDVDPDIVCGDA